MRTRSALATILALALVALAGCASSTTADGAFRMQGDIGTRSDKISLAHREKTRSEIEESVR